MLQGTTIAIGRLGREWHAVPGFPDLGEAPVQKLSLGNNLITARLTAQPPPSGTEQRWDQLLVLFVSDSSSSFSSSETKYNPILQRNSSKLPNPKDTFVPLVAGAGLF
jgi:hypothetical protein